MLLNISKVLVFVVYYLSDDPYNQPERHFAFGAIRVCSV